VFKAQGSYQFPWDLTASANLNINQGANRVLVIPGPGRVYGGTTGTIQYSFNNANPNTLRFQPEDTTRLAPIKLLDIGIQKSFRFNDGRSRLKVMLDGFNIFNQNTILAYSSPNITKAGYTQPTSIVPPRVFRVGASITF
jgi:hypothetical protein